MNKNRFLFGAALALGTAACMEPDPTRAEQRREYAELHAAQMRTYESLQNCGVRARADKEPGTTAYIYAQQNECEREYGEFHYASTRREEWELSH